LPPRYEVEWDERYGEVIITNAYGDTIASWDGEALEKLMAEGVLDPRDMEESALKYAVKMHRIPKYDHYGHQPWQDYRDPEFDCSVKQTEEARDVLRVHAQETLSEIGVTVVKVSLSEIYGGGLSLDVEGSDGRVYSAIVARGGDWRESFNIHPNEEYYECLVYADISEAPDSWIGGDFDENTRAIKGYDYMRNLEEEEEKKRWKKELQPLSFEEWIREVDKLCIKRLGVSFADLPDVTTYRMIYDEGTDPETYFSDDLLPEIEADFGYAFTEDYD